MKQIIFAICMLFLVSGCVTRKIPIMPEAKVISPISEMAAHKLNCEIVDTYVLEKSHPNNVLPVLKNQTFLLGGNRYRVSSVLSERRGKPTGVVAEIYSCPNPYEVKPAGRVNLLPGAHDVKPITFSEIENTDCKVLTSHVVDKTNPDNIYTELSNEVFMRGGNRYHITKIIDTDGANPTSLAADIYRCKHQSVDFH
ncbi:DUF1471 domain-containing protein [Aliivibrio fischeri]|uniref:membrane lipoprotein lipid attachment site-containing protein n=1 Tax=Aliivibrio fischeri TaxID=668 RepID=UPI0012D934CB|nr:membrane lipoprotein lipid attachment site-containing protein [Aliivibrio fischeri]MUJ28918.1 DUF1471 domain-containing protein [Aliivibrio fischeri]MUK39026.1 DUF1471 domain-containing protein [Aliivibrio fischeri]MUL07438.1 DUF1471 domain-containing protein [Aliivibrio fischeri]